jgi:uncharacterized protein YhdP
VDSVVATISIVGGANLANETWNLDAEVKPNLDMSGAAIASGFVVNPLVGLTALIGQYLLRNPIEKAMAIKYSVTGPWESPKINGKTPKAAAGQKQDAPDPEEKVINNGSQPKPTQ